MYRPSKAMTCRPRCSPHAARSIALSVEAAAACAFLFCRCDFGPACPSDGRCHRLSWRRSCGPSFSASAFSSLSSTPGADDAVVDVPCPEMLREAASGALPSLPLDMLLELIACWAHVLNVPCDKSQLHAVWSTSVGMPPRPRPRALVARANIWSTVDIEHQRVCIAVM
jgi:hypothetical protein